MEHNESFLLQDTPPKDIFLKQRIFTQWLESDGVREIKASRDPLPGRVPGYGRTGLPTSSLQSCPGGPAARRLLPQPGGMR
jgi:hypothetical protein